MIKFFNQINNKIILNPRKQCLSPFFLIPLSILIINDLILKKINLLPNAFTGKASDFAGLCIFPLFIAALLNIKKLRPWLLIHILTALTFIFLKIHPTLPLIAAKFYQLLNLNYTTIHDPTDLIALSVLPLSFLLFASSKHTIPQKSKTNLAYAAILTAAFASIATSSVPAPKVYAPNSANFILSDITLVNGTNDTLTIQISKLNSQIKFNCEDPKLSATQLIKNQFKPIGIWNQNPTESTALIPLQTRKEEQSCFVAILTIEDAKPILISWSAHEFPINRIPTSFPIDTPYTKLPKGTILIKKQANSYALFAVGNLYYNYWSEANN